ncbi:SDR family NAD(P)-dependent oxidoreductase [Paenibacillus ginsengarvi]|uniref:SDR family oxidoreductase n=1 Tax=Paenibacillus ginsengarvi TaxID=400777 RepID=A0A3B0AU59_9BACL|nr:SDR family oxidoreductase [Paenibacillus ginsengarvi]RKN64088.1 SDR family oxidoreductase [Paenibacillus ginsengarvi]
MFSLKNKVVVVTGGSGYLGSSVAEGLLAMGAQVAVADRTEWSGLSSWSDQGYWAHCDVSDTASVQEMFRQTKEKFGHIDALVNMATYGAGYGPAGTVDRMTDEDWRIGVDGALGTVFRCTREVIPYLRENGGGSIVNFASMYGVVSPDPRIYGDSGANNPPNYGAGKAGVLQLTRYCAAHLAADQIRVNSITPGAFPNPAQQANQNESFRRLQREKIMMGRVGTPREIVGPVVLLVSDASSYMTGSDITIDGGWTTW